MGITRDTAKKRLDGLARRLHRCRIHGTKLICIREQGEALLDTHEWAGTEAELEEVVDLGNRMKPYQLPLTPSGQLCPRCPDDEPLWCEACCDAQVSKTALIYIPDEVMTQAQYDRYRQLQTLLREKPPTPEPAPPPAHLPLPEPPALPVPALTPQLMPTPQPEPVVDEVEDDEVDEATVDALQGLIAQLTDQLKSRR